MITKNTCWQVKEMILDGMTPTQVAETRGVHLTTIKAYLTLIYKQERVTKFSQLLARYYKENKQLTPLVLSRSQYNVYSLTIQGLSNREIGEKLFVSEKTIKFHNRIIFKIAKVKSRYDLIRTRCVRINMETKEVI